MRVAGSRRTDSRERARLGWSVGWPDAQRRSAVEAEVRPTTVVSLDGGLRLPRFFLRGCEPGLGPSRFRQNCETTAQVLRRCHSSTVGSGLSDPRCSMRPSNRQFIDHR